MAVLTEFAASLLAHGDGAAQADAVRLHMLDTLVALALGLSTPDGALLVRAAGVGVGDGGDLGDGDLVRLAVAAARLTEVDDIHLASGVTPGAIVIPAVMAVARRAARDDRNVPEAIATGYDAAIRFALALGGAELLYRGIWPTYAVAPLAVAAAIARLLGLRASEMASAMGIALAGTTRLLGSGFSGPIPRWHLVGNAAATGLAAARAAQAGISGDPDMPAKLDGIGLPVAMDVLLETPAQRVAEVGFKPFPTSRQGLPAIQAFMDCAVGLRLEEVDRIRVAVPPQYAAMVAGGAFPRSRMEALVSIPYQIALAATAPGRLFDVARADLALGDAASAWMAKVEVAGDPDLGRYYPRQWPGRIHIRLNDGSMREKLLLDPPGSGDAGFAWEDIAAKGRKLFSARGLDLAALDLLVDACAASGLSAGTSGRALGLAIRAGGAPFR